MWCYYYLGNRYRKENVSNCYHLKYITTCPSFSALGFTFTNNTPRYQKLHLKSIFYLYDKDVHSIIWVHNENSPSSVLSQGLLNSKKCQYYLFQVRTMYAIWQWSLRAYKWLF